MFFFKTSPCIKLRCIWAKARRLYQLYRPELSSGVSIKSWNWMGVRSEASKNTPVWSPIVICLCHGWSFNCESCPSVNLVPELVWFLVKIFKKIWKSRDQLWIVSTISTFTNIFSFKHQIPTAAKPGCLLNYSDYQENQI